MSTLNDVIKLSPQIHCCHGRVALSKSYTYCQLRKLSQLRSTVNLSTENQCQLDAKSPSSCRRNRRQLKTTINLELPSTCNHPRIRNNVRDCGTRDRPATASPEQLLLRNVKRFRGELIFKAHRLVHHSTPGWRAIKKKRSTSKASLSIP